MVDHHEVPIWLDMPTDTLKIGWFAYGQIKKWHLAFYDHKAQSESHRRQIRITKLRIFLICGGLLVTLLNYMSLMCFELWPFWMITLFYIPFIWVIIVVKIWTKIKPEKIVVLARWSIQGWFLFVGNYLNNTFSTRKVIRICYIWEFYIAWIKTCIHFCCYAYSLSGMIVYGHLAFLCGIFC